MRRNRDALAATLCLNPDLQPRVRVLAAALGSAQEAAGTISCALWPQRTSNVGDGMLDCGRGVTCNATAHRPPAWMLSKRQTRHGGEAMRLSEWRSVPCEDVPMLTLAAAIEQGLEHGMRVGALKIDAENHECEVISGADFSRARLRPKVMVSEWNQQSSKKCMLDAGERWGYRHAKADGYKEGRDYNAIQVDVGLPAH